MPRLKKPDAKKPDAKVHGSSAVKSSCENKVDLTAKELEILNEENNVPKQIDQAQKADFIEEKQDKDNPDNWNEHDWEAMLNPAEFKCLPSNTNLNRSNGKIADSGHYNSYIPKRFQNHATLQEFIKKYFNHCDQGGARNRRPYTVPGLAHWLGFNSRRGLLKFAQGGSLCGRVVRSALLKIHAQRNEQLVSGQGQMAGRISDLKNNFGWNDLTPFSHEEQAHRESLEKKREEEGEGKKEGDSKHLHLHSMLPPEPKSMEEWANMYQDYMKKKKVSENAALTEKNEKEKKK